MQSASYSRMTVGNTELPAALDLQRGLWKHQYSQRAPVQTFDGIRFEDPVQPGLGRRQQTSMWYVTINTNKIGRLPKRRTQLKRAKHMGYPVARGEAMGAAVLAGLTSDVLDTKNILTEIVGEVQSNPLVHAQIFAFGNAINASRARSTKARAGETYKELRQPLGIAKAFAMDRALVMHSMGHRAVFKKITVSDFTPEVGPQGGGVHCHFFLEVIHYSQLQLDYQSFPQVLRRMWNAACDRIGKDHLKYKGVNPKSGKPTAPCIHAKLQDESGASEHVNIAAGNKYGTKESAASMAA